MLSLLFTRASPTRTNIQPCLQQRKPPSIHRLSIKPSPIFASHFSYPTSDLDYANFALPPASESISEPKNSTIHLGIVRTMFSVADFQNEDLLKINSINLDPYTETYGIQFYAQYMCGRMPFVFYKAEDKKGRLAGYLMGKLEGEGDQWHGHITAITVGDAFRRQGVARLLMDKFEKLCIEQNCYFIDLYVRISNKVAVEMYTKMGYIVYQQIIEYYSGEDPEDGYDMHKALPADVDKLSMIPKPHPVTCEEVFGTNE
uniref:N-alpha-acetyltransferase 20 n=1 Tax=Panagrellus redivivus TaxID=6233 RepID=A0A7E4V8R5_PANRE